MYKRVTRTLVQGKPWVPGVDIDAIAIPTDFPITKINVLFKGTPAGSTSGAGSLQNSLWPAVANVVGNITLVGTPLDGSEGFKLENIPAGLLWFRSWMMNAVQPAVTDLTAAAVATAVNIDIPIHFADERLPEDQKILTALEAQRYGGGQTSALNLKIKCGNVQATKGADVDRVGIVGGSYGTITAGTLAYSVTVEQLVPLNGQFAHFTSPNALSFYDLNVEYMPLAAIAQNNANGLTLQARGLQYETFFLNTDRDANQLETAVNNLGVTPLAKLVEKMGSVSYGDYDPTMVRNSNLARYLANATTFPTGVYAFSDSDNNLAKAYHLYKHSASHTWDLNLGSTSLTDSVLRVAHFTYNFSRAAKKRQKV